MSDEKLALLAQSGDKHAENALLERYSGLVRSKARGFFLVGGETEDLIQEGMIGLYFAVNSYKEGAPFKNYASVCVTRRIIDAIKSSNRQKNSPLNDYVSISGEEDSLFYGGDIEEELIRTESTGEFFKKISKVLSDTEFRVTVLYLNGMSHLEIVEATGKNYKSVDNALSRAKSKLQKIYKNG